jgi:LAO/AO transport system kinase
MELVDNLLKGDRRALAKLITLIENGDPAVPGVLSAIYPNLGRAYVIGITGPPGAGKSTIVDNLIQRWRDEGANVGAVLIDPSSPFSGGAILGDRIRMQRHALDDGVYIRSLGTRGSRGGLTRSTRQVVQLLDAAGFARIVIETVGVGQTELDVMEVADTTIVILGPESGDTVQTMKAGLMEIADIFVVNKADREGASRMVAEISAMLDLRENDDEWRPPVYSCQANRAVGIDEIIAGISKHRSFLEEHDLRESHRRALRRVELVEILSEYLRNNLMDSAAREPLEPYFRQVENMEISPYEAADLIFGANLLETLFNRSSTK